MTFPPSASPRERLVVLYGGAFIALVLIAGRVVPIAHQWNELTVAEVAQDIRRVRSVEALAADRNALDSAINSEQTRLDSMDIRTIAAATPAAAGVDLSATLEHLAERHRVRVGSTIVLAESAFVASAARVSVRLFGETDSMGLFDILASIESSALGIRVTELIVTQAEPSATSETPEVLRVELLVSARARPAREERQ